MRQIRFNLVYRDGDTWIPNNIGTLDVSEEDVVSLRVEMREGPRYIARASVGVDGEEVDLEVDWVSFLGGCCFFGRDAEREIACESGHYEYADSLKGLPDG